MVKKLIYNDWESIHEWTMLVKFEFKSFSSFIFLSFFVYNLFSVTFTPTFSLS